MAKAFAKRANGARPPRPPQALNRSFFLMLVSRSLKNYQCSTEGRKLHQNVAPVLAIILWMSLVFPQRMAPRTVRAKIWNIQAFRKKSLADLMDECGQHLWALLTQALVLLFRKGVDETGISLKCISRVTHSASGWWGPGMLQTVSRTLETM